MPTERPPVAHLHALDGLRGIAVLGVMAFHLSSLDRGDRSGLLGGGWLGVDLFFTLSGYLITSLLLTELTARGGIDLGAFWRRRLRRLQPAALVAITVIVATAGWWSAPGTGRLVRQQALAAVSGVANWQLLWAHRPYAAGASASGFEHFWSLAVEEQFYVVWPLVVTAIALVLGARRHLARRVVLAVAGTGVAVSWVLLASYPLQRAYLGTDARMGAILLGAGLATFLPMDRVAGTVTGRRRATAAAWVGLAASAALWLGAGWPPHLSLGLVLPAQGLATVGLIAGMVLAPRSAPARLLATSPLAGLGRVSYGAYLWHWPVFVLLTPHRLGAGWLPTTVVRLTAVAVLTFLSWRLVERPIRLNLVLTRTRLALPVALLAVALVSTIAARSVSPTPAWAGADGSLVLHAAATGDSPVSAGSGPTRVLVVGDSIATSLVSGPTETVQAGTGHLFDHLAARGIAAAGATIAGCPVVEQAFLAESGVNRRCILSQQRRLPEAMDRFRPDLVVWYSRQEAYPSVLADDTVSTSATALRARYAQRLRWFAARGAKVLLVSPGPTADGYEASSPMGRPESMVELDRTITRVGREHPDIVVGVVHMQDLLCDGATRGCPDRRPDGGRYRIDGVHFLGPGELLASEWLAARIATVGGFAHP